MLIAIKFAFLAVLICVTCEENQEIDTEHLSNLRAAGNHEEYARLMGIDDVNMLIPDEESKYAEYTRASPLGDIMFTAEEARQGMNFRSSPQRKWPNNVIPYVIDTRDFTENQVAYIRNYVNLFNSKDTNVKIRERWGEKDYVLIINGKGCWSYLGRIGGQQLMSLNSDYCLFKAIIFHEFLHALGIVHEHTRSDRDTYVHVNTENIDSEWQSQYEKVDSNGYDNHERYDYYSCMHYGMRAPGTGKAAFQIKQPNIRQEYIGQREDMTSLDVRKIKSLYS